MGLSRACITTHGAFHVIMVYFFVYVSINLSRSYKLFLYVQLSYCYCQVHLVTLHRAEFSSYFVSSTHLINNLWQDT